MSRDSDTAPDPRLAESEQRYQAVIENASDMIQSVRPDGTFEFVNKAWRDTLGYDDADLPGLTVWDVIHPESVEHCQPFFQRAMRGESVPHVETLFRTKDGRSIPTEGNVSARVVGTTVVATHGFFRDISERLRAQALERANALLETERAARYLEKMAALGKLSAGLAHELNNPAAAIQRASSRHAESLVRRDGLMQKLAALGLDAGHWTTVATLLAEVGSLGATQEFTLDPLAVNERESEVEAWLEDRDIDRAWDVAPGLAQAGISAERLDQFESEMPAAALGAAVAWLNETLTLRETNDIISRGSHRISELVQAVKGYSYMDRATEQVADLHEGLESTLLILHHKLRNVTVKRDYDRTVPPVRIFGNSLNQVWTNLLDNAIDATDGTGSIVIRTRRDGAHGVVEIEDSGAGIPPENLTRIFEPFFTTKPQGVGTGLGLDMAWRIVTAEHCGTIDVTSEPGRTVFRVAVPLAPPANALSP